MEGSIKEILISREEIAERVKVLGEKISRDYFDKKLMVIGILKGSFIFMADLVREITRPLEIDFMLLSSYGNSLQSSGQVNILKDLGQSIRGKEVMIVEDIIDTGLTLKWLTDTLLLREPSSLRTCTLLDKPSRRIVEITPDYNGFIIPDSFVVGYGLDYSERYRNLSDIVIVEP
ncbi:MAG: hypoxanthine phosphoribosyltransferase [Peptococcaceae bacterium]|nr:hypoxanthine phosphoribosyltransferase [Peptococcaceae bacterium]